MTQEFKNYEQQIEQSLRSASFFDVGKALGIIRDQQLYIRGGRGEDEKSKLGIRSNKKLIVIK